MKTFSQLILEQNNELNAFVILKPEFLKYEQQWLDRGLTIKYINLILDHTTELTEPEVEIEFDTYRSFSRGEIQCPELCNPQVTIKQN